ncbi:MAG: gamma-glutamyltransferase, partial [Bacteroidota bacterium]
GGNAVDAVIAVQFALAVVYPRAGNIGGGGFMVIRQADGSTNALDYREKAPAAASRDMYLDSAKNVIQGLSTIGHLASGVPGTVAGMWEAHQKYGKLEWSELVRPAYELAKNGFKLSVTETNRLNRFKSYFKEYNTTENIFTQQDTFLKGSNLVQSELAATLKLIEAGGKDGFYQGKTADLLVAEMERGNGIITLEDLANYEAQWRTPITADYKNYRLISMPPSSSGGIAVAQMLKMIENYPLNKYGFHTPESVHLMAEVERRAFADRSKHLGDSDFYDVPMEELLSDEYLKGRMADYDDYYPTSSDSIAGGEFEMVLESFETTHTSIVDAEGNAVSVTTTLNSNYGSKVVVGGAGFFMNNEMDDFSSKPGVPNQFGLIGAEANAIQPGKRMLSSMT